MTRRGDTLLFDAPPTVAAWAAAGGKKESEGPLASAFDFVTQDAAFGEQGCENWEQAESSCSARPWRSVCARRIFRVPKSILRLRATCRPSVRPATTRCGNWASRLRRLRARARPWRRRWALPRCLRRAAWPSGPGADKQPFCAAERQFRTPLSYGAVRTPRPSGLPPLLDAAFCSRRAKALALPLPPLAVCRIIR